MDKLAMQFPKPDSDRDRELKNYCIELESLLSLLPAKQSNEIDKIAISSTQEYVVLLCNK
jgi:hypothetical protein